MNSGGGGAAWCPSAHAFKGLFLVTFDGCSCLALSYLGGFLIEFPSVYFGEGTCFFTGTLEAAQGDIERFIISNFYKWHTI